jgi:hypothetical protein
MKTGYYAPLTMAGMSEIDVFVLCLGTLLVNDVAASCFANVEKYEMIQFYMRPLRWYYRLSRLLSVEKPFGDDNVDGIHYIPKMFYEIAQSIYPSILRLN